MTNVTRRSEKVISLVNGLVFSKMFLKGKPLSSQGWYTPFMLFFGNHCVYAGELVKCISSIFKNIFVGRGGVLLPPPLSLSRH